MVPSETMPGVEGLAAAGAVLATRTPAHAAAVADAEAGIGGGTLGRAFQGRHQQASRDAQTEAGRLTGEFQEVGAAGRTAVSAYRAADAVSAHEFGR